MKFEKGDIVQVHYASPTKIEEWMKGWLRIGPGDIGFVTQGLLSDAQWGDVTVNFPLIGVVAMWSVDLKIVAKASEK